MDLSLLFLSFLQKFLLSSVTINLDGGLSKIDFIQKDLIGSSFRARVDSKGPPDGSLDPHQLLSRVLGKKIPFIWEKKKIYSTLS